MVTNRSLARYAHENSLRIIPIKLGHRYPPEPPDVHGRKQNEEIFKRILYLDGKKMEERDVAETWFELEVPGEAAWGYQLWKVHRRFQYMVMFDTLVFQISNPLWCHRDGNPQDLGQGRLTDERKIFRSVSKSDAAILFKLPSFWRRKLWALKLMFHRCSDHVQKSGHWSASWFGRTTMKAGWLPRETGGILLQHFKVYGRLQFHSEVGRYGSMYFKAGCFKIICCWRSLEVSQS